ncbi:hypothetical protein [Phormidesmis sp. 146-33]
MNKIELDILQAVVDEQKVNPSIAVTEYQIAERVELDLQEIRANLNLLKRQGCVQLEDLGSHSGEAVWAKITPEGSMALQGRNEFLTKEIGISIGNLIQVEKACNSQFQQGTHNSTQSLFVDNTSKAALSELLNDIKKLVNSLELDAQTKDELQSDIQTLEAQASNPKPKKAIFKAVFASIASILKGATEKAISTELASHAPSVLQRIHEFLQNMG